MLNALNRMHTTKPQSGSLLDQKDDIYDDFINPTLSFNSREEEVIIIPPPVSSDKTSQHQKSSSSNKKSLPSLGVSTVKAVNQTAQQLMKKASFKAPVAAMKGLYKKTRSYGEHLRHGNRDRFSSKSKMIDTSSHSGDDLYQRQKIHEAKALRYIPPQNNRWRSSMASAAAGKCA